MQSEGLTKIEKRKTNGTTPSVVPAPIAHIDHTVIQIATNAIRFSPFNRIGAREPDAELVADVKRRGILSPILVRDQDGPTWELIFGERRVRAAMAAKLESVPAFKAKMTDAEVIETQIVENAKRRDLHPIEEAEAFAILRDKFQYDADTIAAKCGKSRSYVFQRMKLLELTPKAREAFVKGEISASVALYVARVPTEKVQSDALREIKNAAWEGEPVSARRAHEIIEERFMLKLADAAFDITDATLVVAAGACSTCPKRTGNQAELFADVKSGDVCTDPTCFAEKKKAGWSRTVAAAKEKNQAVIPTEKAFPSNRYGHLASDFVDLGDKNYADPKQRTWSALLKGEMPEVAITRDSRGEIHKIVKALDAQRALVKIGHSFAKPPPKAKPAKAARNGIAVDDKVEELAYTMTLEAVVAKAEAKEPNAEWWAKAIDIFEGAAYSDLNALLARRSIDVGRNKGNVYAELAKVIKSMKAAELRGLFVEIMCWPGEGTTGELAAFAKLYGVDTKAIAKRAKDAIEKATGVDVKTLRKMPAKDEKAILNATKKLPKKKGKRA